MSIRIANETDLPQIVEIYNQAVAQCGVTADLSPVTPGVNPFRIREASD